MGGLVQLPAPATLRRRSPRRSGTVLITAVAGIFGVATSFTPPSGQTERADLQHAALWAAMEVSTETYSGTSATGTLHRHVVGASSLATYGIAHAVSLMLTDQTVRVVRGRQHGRRWWRGSPDEPQYLPGERRFDNSGGTAKFDTFQAMSGRRADMVDEHPRGSTSPAQLVQVPAPRRPRLRP